VSVVDETVEDGVGVGRVADHGVPFVDRDLAGEDGRAAAIAFLEDLVEIVAGAGVERFETPIIEDQQLDAGEALEDPVRFKNSSTSVSVTRPPDERLGSCLTKERPELVSRMNCQRSPFELRQKSSMISNVKGLLLGFERFRHRCLVL
jgi:hypothetical protein